MYRFEWVIPHREFEGQGGNLMCVSVIINTTRISLSMCKCACVVAYIKIYELAYFFPFLSFFHVYMTTHFSLLMSQVVTGVATISRLLKIIGLFRKRALQKMLILWIPPKRCQWDHDSLFLSHTNSLPHTFLLYHKRHTFETAVTTGNSHILNATSALQFVHGKIVKQMWTLFNMTTSALQFSCHCYSTRDMTPSPHVTWHFSV